MEIIDIKYTGMAGAGKRSYEVLIRKYGIEIMFEFTAKSKKELVEYYLTKDNYTIDKINTAFHPYMESEPEVTSEEVYSPETLKVFIGGETFYVHSAEILKIVANKSKTDCVYIEKQDGSTLIVNFSYVSEKHVFENHKHNWKNHNIAEKSLSKLKSEVVSNLNADDIDVEIDFCIGIDRVGRVFAELIVFSMEYGLQGSKRVYSPSMFMKDVLESECRSIIEDIKVACRMI